MKKKKLTVKQLIAQLRENKENKAIDYLISEALGGRTIREKYRFLSSLFSRSKDWAFRCKEPVFYVAKTYTVYQPEGDCDGEGGFSLEPTVYTLSDVLHLTEHEIGYYENLEIGPYSQSLYETDGVTDSATGELTIECLHIDGTPDGLWTITNILAGKMKREAA